MTTALIPLSQIIARDAMHTPVISCEPDTDLGEVAELMAKHRIHCVVVDGIRHARDGDHLVWGVVSDLDLVRAAISAGHDTTAGSIAATPAICVDPDDDLVVVAAMIADNDCTHAVVVEDERPVGVISTLDIASAAAPRGSG